MTVNNLCFNYISCNLKNWLKYKFIISQQKREKKSDLPLAQVIHLDLYTNVKETSQNNSDFGL